MVVGETLIRVFYPLFLIVFWACSSRPARLLCAILDQRDLVYFSFLPLMAVLCFSPARGGCSLVFGFGVVGGSLSSGYLVRLDYQAVEMSSMALSGFFLWSARIQFWKMSTR